MSQTSIQTSAFWNDPANDILKNNKEFVGAYVDTMLNTSVLKDLFEISDTNEINEKFTSFEAPDGVDIVPEGQNISNFNLGKGYEMIMSPFKYAKRIEMTYEMLQAIKDPTRDANEVIARSSNFILAGFKKAMESRCISYFDNAFNATTTSNISYKAPDGKALIDSNHDFSTGGTFDNTLTNAALTTATIDEVIKKATDTLGADGKPIGLMPNTLFCRHGSAVHREAMRIFGYNKGSNNGQYQTPTLGNVNIYEG